jgi:hypothetical protein
VKKQLTKGPRQFPLGLLAYGNHYYIERVVKLEKALARKPRSIQINMIGVGEIPADIALLIRSVLLERSPKTRLITNARSSLQGGSVLVWLLGDDRIIRDDARIFFRPAKLPDEEEEGEDAVWKEGSLNYRDSFSEVEPEEGDYARVLQLINEFLPVKELAGRIIEMFVLRQFGLVENENADRFLATVFARKQGKEKDVLAQPDEKRTRPSFEPSRRRQTN